MAVSDSYFLLLLNLMLVVIFGSSLFSSSSELITRGSFFVTKGNDGLPLVFKVTRGENVNYSASLSVRRCAEYIMCTFSLA